MIAFGIVKPGATLRIPFDSFAAATGASSALSNFAVGDILVYKDGNGTARASTTGYTATTSFSSVTGINEAVIDLSSDATADFFKAGSNYVVVISPVTVDSQTVAFVAATFTIGYGFVLDTSIATLASQTSFTLTAGPAEDDALNGMWAIVHDKASAVQMTWVQILDYTGSTKTVTLAATPAATFTIAAIDNFSVIGVMPLQPTVIGRALDVSTGGEAGLDWANIGSPTTAQNLSSTNIDTDQVVASVAGAVGSVTGLTASNLDATISSRMASYTQPTGFLAATFPTTVASTTNITAGTITTATNVTNVNGLAANVITAASMASDAGAEIADAVWDEDATGHQTQGTFGQAIGDPVADTNTIYKAVVTDATGATVGVDVVAVKAETASIQTDTNDLQTQIGTAGAGLTNINLPNQTMDITGTLTGNIVGSMSGDVGGVSGNVAGSVGSVVGDVGGTINGFTTVALREIFETNTGKTYADAVAGSVVKEIADNAGGGGGGLDAAGVRAAIGMASANLDTQLAALPTAGENADAVWDEAIAGHTGEGTTGGYLSIEGLDAAGVRAAIGMASADLDTQLNDIAAVTDKLDTMIEDADVPNSRYTAAALENIPTAGEAAAADIWNYEIEGNPASELLDRAGSKSGQ